MPKTPPTIAQVWETLDAELAQWSDRWIPFARSGGGALTVRADGAVVGD